MEMPFIAYTGSFELAARELADTPEAQDNPRLQASICRKHSIFLDCITDEEAALLSLMVEKFAKEGQY